jgi:hypothetical protein
VDGMRTTQGAARERSEARHTGVAVLGRATWGPGAGKPSNQTPVTARSTEPAVKPSHQGRFHRHFASPRWDWRWRAGGVGAVRWGQ